MMKFKVVAFAALAISLFTLNSTFAYASSKPVCVNIPSQYVPVGRTVQFSIVASDPNGLTLSYSVLSMPQGASFIGNTFTWTPGYNQTGTFTPLLRAFNGSEYCDVSVQIVVPKDGTVTGTQPNTAPMWDGNPTQYTTTVGRTLQFYVGAWDPNGDMLTYDAFPLPQHATFDKGSRLFTWTPRADQARSYQIRFRAIDRATFSDLLVTINVLPGAGSTGTTNISTSHRYVATPGTVTGNLTLFNERVDINEDGNVLISWDTDKPARGLVHYGLLSQADRSDFQYEFISPEDSQLSTHHQISLGDKFEKQRSYYFRVVATVGNNRAVSTEHSFILLNEGGVTGSATITETLGGIFFGPLLWIVIIILLVLYFFNRRKKGVESHHDDSDEIVIGGHEEETHH